MVHLCRERSTSLPARFRLLNRLHLQPRGELLSRLRLWCRFTNMRPFLFFLFAGIASAQIDSTKWFVNNMADTNTNQVCFTPANLVETNGTGVVQTVKAQTLTCGNSTAAQASHSFTGARMQTQQSYGPFGVIQFQITTNAQLGHALWAVVWLLGNYCLTAQKVNPGGVCSPQIWDNQGADEIDMWEEDGTNNNGGANLGPCTTAPCYDFNFHSTAGTNKAWYGATAANTTYTVIMDWEASNNLTFYLNGVSTYTPTNPVPHSPAGYFITFDTRLTGLTTAGMTFPFTRTLGYMRWCPAGTNTGGVPSCTQAQATSCSGTPTQCFDDEFTGTQPQTQFYVAQTPQGLMTGADCADALGLLNNGQTTFVNDPGWWSGNTGTNIIQPGATINVCGATSTQLNAQGSGTMGSPITFNLLAGSSGTASANGQSFINIQGPPAGSVNGGNQVKGGNAIWQ